VRDGGRGDVDMAACFDSGGREERERSGFKPSGTRFDVSLLESFVVLNALCDKRICLESRGVIGDSAVSLSPLEEDEAGKQPPCRETELSLAQLNSWSVLS
jgi:hypothetical protein